MRFLLGMIIVASVHFLLGSTLYYGRIKEVSSILDSDWVVLALPCILAISGYFCVFWQAGFLGERLTWRIVLAAIVALVAAAVSGLATFIFVLNRFGS